MRLRLATFNLESLDDRPDGTPTLKDRIAALKPLLLALDADILCLQEVNGQPKDGHRRRLAALDAVLEGTPYGAFSRALTEGVHGPYDVHNLVTLSRFPIAARRPWHHDAIKPLRYRSAALDLRIDEGLAVGWDRPALVTVHDLGRERSLTAVNLHLRAPLAAAIPGGKLAPGVWASPAAWAEGFFLAAVKRTGQATEARLYVDRTFDADADAWIAVTGDLNAGRDEMPVRVLIAGVEDTGNPAQTHRQLAVLDDRIPAATRYSVRHDGRPLMPDHILASPALARHCLRVEAFNDGLYDEVRDAGDPAFAGSYHAPVVATFDLPES